MCGNGARAASWYAYMKGIAPKKITFDVLDVIYHAEIIDTGVRLQMPPPVEINLHPGALEESFFEEGGYLNVGVPHYVLFTENIDEIDVYSIGKKYRHHPKFQPWGTNTNFVQIIGENELKMRTYERGVEQETLACGTGTISSAIVAYKQKGIEPPIKVTAPGGTLFVEFDPDLKNITLTGEVNIVFEGELVHH
jgi:diaminopimelate epimerase